MWDLCSGTVLNVAITREDCNLVPLILTLGDFLSHCL